MTKRLFKFDTLAEYDAVKDTLEKPYVAIIKENNGIQYNTDVVTGSNANDSANFMNITWAELKALRDSKALTIGTYYRITDYVTTTLQENTRSAGHPFDIIVLATDTDTLSEEAMAAVHEGDTYFSNSNLSAWKIWYSLDNDANKYGWVSKNILLGKIKPASGVSASGIYTYDKPIEKVKFLDILYNLSIGIETMIMSGPPVYVTLIDSYTLQVREVATGYVAATKGISVYSEEIIGKGVIYRMIDEYNNDLPYDFKNIIYMAKPSFSVYTHYGSSYFATFTVASDTQTIEGITYYKYTMTYIADGPFTPPNELWTDSAIPTTEMGVYTIVDGTVNKESYTLFKIATDKYDAYTFSIPNYNDINDGSLSGSVYDNTIKEYRSVGVLQLNRIIFISTSSTINCYNNSFGNDCHDIKCVDNRGSKGYRYNSFGNNITQCEFFVTDGSYSYVQNCRITNGFSGTIGVGGDRDYETTVALDSDGEIKVYCAADFDKQIENSIISVINTEV